MSIQALRERKKELARLANKQLADKSPTAHREAETAKAHRG